jgi:peptidoglycan/xylan/chitin deacetylase (PgdA/CDA1 family)
MYHRIGSPAVDPWQLSVSEKNFEQHLRLLQRQKIVQPLPSIIGDLKERKLDTKCIALTFDDGYADNYLIAKPLLEKYGIPATFFITSRNVDSKNEFWWDELAKILLLTKQLPPTLSLEINGLSFFYDLGEETSLTAELTEHHKEYIAYQPKTLRSELYYKLWESFSPMPTGEQLQLLNKIREWAGVPGLPRPEFLCLTSSQIKDLTDSKLFNTGGHTASHPMLSNYNKEAQHEEILGNKLFLEQIAGQKIDLFAYPSGKHDASTIEILKQLNFDAAFTTNAKTVKNDSDPFTLGRFQVNNCTGDELKKMLLKWSDQ